jgi:hypothetical protein
MYTEIENYSGSCGSRIRSEGLLNLEYENHYLSLGQINYTNIDSFPQKQKIFQYLSIIISRVLRPWAPMLGVSDPDTMSTLQLTEPWTIVFAFTSCARERLLNGLNLMKDRIEGEILVRIWKQHDIPLMKDRIEGEILVGIWKKNIISL